MQQWLSRLRRGNVAVTAVRQGLMLSIPLLLMGSLALVLVNIPVAPYQQWLTGAAAGWLRPFLMGVYQLTFDSLALLLILTVGYSYGLEVMAGDSLLFYPVTAVCCYIGFVRPVAENNAFGPEWVFTALCITLLSCWMLRKWRGYFLRHNGLYTIGAEYNFNVAMQALLPVFCTATLFTVAGVLLEAATGTPATANFGSFLFFRLFERMGVGLGSTLLYILFSHLLWFFGIHGTNTLEAVARSLFAPEIQLNQLQLAQGLAPTHIFSKTFIDTFAFIGGCGAACCLVAALFLVSRKAYTRRLAKFSLVPIFFNVSEIAVFGLPIIFNPIMAIPFVLTPLVLAAISSGAMMTGLVPVAVHEVEWTVPVFFSGYVATGSWRGAALQLVNLIVGTILYIPFVRLNEQRLSERFRDNVKRLEENMRRQEETAWSQEFRWENARDRRTAQVLTNDLRHAIRTGKLELFFQPQMERSGGLYGAEALLRWNYAGEEFVYPPLIVALAVRAGFMEELGYHILEMACRNLQEMEQRTGRAIHLSVNVLPMQMRDPAFTDRLTQLLARYGVRGDHLTVEFTEQVALQVTPAFEQQAHRLRERGVRFSMDDFGMGHSSLLYLNDGLFDEVKIDGELVRQIPGSERVCEIIAGIMRLSEGLHFQVVAERVEDQPQVERLAQLGCTIYQGYFYSRPLPLPAFLAFLEEHPDAVRELEARR